MIMLISQPISGGINMKKEIFRDNVTLGARAPGASPHMALKVTTRPRKRR
jgi:hypothetical protein